jgi:ubiquinone biosynthesis protein COQ4
LIRSKEKREMNAFQKRVATARVLWSFVDLVRHPEHLDRVFEISSALSATRRDVLARMRDHLAKDARGAKALAEKPRLTVNLDELGALPVGSLGRTFADHMRSNGLDPAAIPSLPSDGELEYVRAHLYETHDVWHAVTGFATDVAGELGLQAFYAAQTPGGLPLMLLAMGCLNTALYSMQDRERRLDAISRGWAMGKQARPLFGVRWADLWGHPIAEVRESLGIEPYAPPATERLAA